jgi:predicted phosphodiesterase
MLGLLSDVHGNRTALEAVVADGAGAGVDAWWVLGDLAAI